MRVLKVSSIVLLNIFLVSCATSMKSEAKKIVESDEAKMQSCDVLGTVTGSSGWAGLTTESLKRSAVNEALNDASDLGATHIVWTYVSESNSGGRASGKAYGCVN